MARIAPSILAADFSNLSASIQRVTGVELLHLDVMDGQFVPNISFGQPVIDSLRDESDLYFDTHLMIERPERYLDDFAAAGSDRLTVHAEACEDPAATLEAIHDLGIDAGLAINPETSVESISEYLGAVDNVLVMSVQPGFGGQEFKPETVEKIARLAERPEDVEIEVDGGIDAETGARCAAAGAETFVIGSSLFGQDDVEAALAELQETLT